MSNLIEMHISRTLVADEEDILAEGVVLEHITEQANVMRDSKELNLRHQGDELGDMARCLDTIDRHCLIYPTNFIIISFLP